MLSGVLKSINKGINKLIRNSTKHTIKGKDYYEEKLLAEGGYGYVYLVEDHDTGVKFALKKMHYHDNEGLANIKSEVDLWKRVNNHINIVKLIDYEISESFVLILMELGTEGTLLEFINNRVEVAISENQALYVIKEIANGISHMHSQSPPIAHRDIKIENVLKIGNNYKLCDFGSTSVDTLDPRKESKQTVLDSFSKFERMTTFIYRPPEMCDPYSKFPICEKVDIWMLGCILYALLFKLHPFQDAQKLTIINAHYYIPENTYSEKIIDFMRLMLTPNPLNRPSAKDVINTINGWANMKTVSLPDETKGIKEKQMRNVKTNKNDLLSAEELNRVQKEIMKEQAKKNKYKINKDDDGDINEMFDDLDVDDNSNVRPGKGEKKSKNNENSKNQNLGNSNSSKPFDGFNNMNNSNKTSTQGEWMIDFNQGFNNNTHQQNQNVNNVNNNQFDNQFGFDFLEDTSKSKKGDDFSNLNNVFSNTTNSNSNPNNKTNTKPANKKSEHSDFGDFIFTNTNPTINTNTICNQNNQSKSSNQIPNIITDKKFQSQNGFDFDKFNSGNNQFSNYGNNMNMNNNNSGNNKVNVIPNVTKQSNMNGINAANIPVNKQVTQNKNNGEQNIYDFFK